MALGVTFLIFALTAVSVGNFLLVPGILAGAVGAGLLAWSRENLPRWAGLTILGYMLVTVLFFLAATPLTVRIGGTNYFVNDQPNLFLDAVFDSLVLGLPFVLVAASTVAVWERGWPRWLLLGAMGGVLLAVVLTILSNPGEPTAEASQSSVLNFFVAFVGLVAATGAFGAAWTYREDESSQA